MAIFQQLIFKKKHLLPSKLVSSLSVAEERGFDLRFLHSNLPHAAPDRKGFYQRLWRWVLTLRVILIFLFTCFGVTNNLHLSKTKCASGTALTACGVLLFLPQSGCHSWRPYHCNTAGVCHDRSSGYILNNQTDAIFMYVLSPVLGGILNLCNRMLCVQKECKVIYHFLSVYIFFSTVCVCDFCPLVKYVFA